MAIGGPGHADEERASSPNEAMSLHSRETPANLYLGYDRWVIPVMA